MVRTLCLMPVEKGTEMVPVYHREAVPWMTIQQNSRFLPGKFHPLIRTIASRRSIFPGVEPRVELLQEAFYTFPQRLTVYQSTHIRLGRRRTHETSVAHAPLDNAIPGSAGPLHGGPCRQCPRRTRIRCTTRYWPRRDLADADTRNLPRLCEHHAQSKCDGGRRHHRQCHVLLLGRQRRQDHRDCDVLLVNVQPRLASRRTWHLQRGSAGAGYGECTPRCPATDSHRWRGHSAPAST